MRLGAIAGQYGDFERGCQVKWAAAQDGLGAYGRLGFLAALAVAVAVLGSGAAEAPDGPDAHRDRGGGSAADIMFVEDEEEGGEAEGPASPFGTGKGTGARKDAVPGYVELSSGLKMPGRIFTTRAKRLKVYNIEKEIYEYVPVPALKRIEAVVVWERQQRQWRFKEAGSTEKVYTGETYPARMLSYRLTLRNDHRITGDVLGQPLYIAREDRTDRFVLHKRRKGAVGESLEDLVYIRAVVFGREAYEQAVMELRGKGPREAEEQ